MVRHGETDWNREDRFQGHSDPPLNDRGRSQARALAQALGGLEAAALYSSPLARVAAGRPLGRLARAEEIAAVVVFLCSERSSYVTGAAWSADGGTVPIIV